VIRVREATVRFGAKVVFDRLSLELPDGAAIAVVGPSGSGKTTFLRALFGFVPLEHGSIEIDGTRVDGASQDALRRLRLQMGYVAQGHDLIDTLSVERNVLYGELGHWTLARTIRSLLWLTPAERAHAQTQLRPLGIEALGARRVKTLSGGERQRVAIARAMIGQPRVVVADEPVASLDPERAREVLALLVQGCRERNATLIATLHQPDLAAAFFSTIVDFRRDGI